MKMANPEPLVCAIMLTRDRPAMARRAVEAFLAQTYPASHRAIFILDSGAHANPQLPYGERLATTLWVPDQAQQSIGSLRNGALRAAAGYLGSFDVVVHWDDDDWSHSNRIAEQVALLQSSGADVVGYREMLFWRSLAKTPLEQHILGNAVRGGVGSREKAFPEQAWLYSHPHPSYCVGTSLCYWRRTWEARKFRDISNGEEHWFCEGRKCVGESSLKAGEPRMIASIHGSNTGPNYNIEALIARGSREWKRAQEWDEYCRERMRL